MMRPGEEIVAGGRLLPVTYADRERVIRTLEAAQRSLDNSGAWSVI